MAYTYKDYKTDKALKEAFASGKKIACYQPGGMFELRTGQSVIEGPHGYHKFYVSVTIDTDCNISHIDGKDAAWWAEKFRKAAEKTAGGGPSAQRAKH